MKNKMIRGLVVAGMVSMMLTACGSKETLGTADTEVTKTTDEQEENTVPESAMETVEENVTKVDVETENETTTATQVEVLADVSREEKIDIIIDEISNAGNRVLSYPFFTQYDPRDSMDEDKAEYYDTVLLQIDSYWNENNEELILWGDMGVANFFINSEALKNKDFSQVMYSWDCM